MIPDDVVERVRTEADAVAIIGEFVKLKRTGSSFRGPCPFHGGKNPNFSLGPRGGYVCFKCGEKGDVFTFIQKHLGLDFVEAVKWVGERAGVEVREVSRKVEGPDPREPLWELNTTAAEYFRDQLWSADAAGAAREYLASRGISREDADRFGLGYSPMDRNALRSHLTALGFEDDRQVAGGLLALRENQTDPAPRFRNRLMIPIADHSGHIIGFGGRVLGDGQPKYLNSPESEVFAKGRTLYALNWAKHATRKADRLFIVEGYFDVIRMMLAGIEEVVAPMGTALTDAQATLIRKFTKTVYLVYDSDSAGQKATFRSGDALLAVGATVRVITLPNGEDPDTFIRKEGAAGVERAVEASVDIYDRKIQILERAGYFADLRRKREALDKLLPTLRATADPITADLYITRTCEVAGVSRDLLDRELAAAAAKAERAPAQHDEESEVPRSAVRRADRRRDHTSPGSRAERELIRILLHQRKYVESVGERVGPDSFQDEAYRQIFAELIDQGAEAGPEELARPLDDDAVGILQDLLEERGGLDRSDEIVTGSVNALLARDADRRLREIDRELPIATGAEQDALIREKEQLRREIQELGRPRWKGFNSH